MSSSHVAGAGIALPWCRCKSPVGRRLSRATVLVLQIMLSSQNNNTRAVAHESIHSASSAGYALVSRSTNPPGPLPVVARAHVETCHACSRASGCPRALQSAHSRSRPTRPIPRRRRPRRKDGMYGLRFSPSSIHCRQSASSVINIARAHWRASRKGRKRGLRVRIDLDHCSESRGSINHESSSSAAAASRSSGAHPRQHDTMKRDASASRRHERRPSALDEGAGRQRGQDQEQRYIITASHRGDSLVRPKFAARLDFRSPQAPRAVATHRPFCTTRKAPPWAPRVAKLRRSPQSAHRNPAAL